MSIIIMGLSAIRRKKFQNILIAVTILVTSLLLSTSLGLINCMNKPFETLHAKLKTSHVLLRIKSDVYDANKLNSWWKEQKEVKSTNLVQCYQTGVWSNKKLIYYPYIIERPLKAIDQDKLLLLHGKKETSPGKGEIWISNDDARNYGLKVGDKLTIKQKNQNVSYRISAIAIDPASSSGMAYSAAWVRHSCINSELSKSSKMYTLGIRLYNYGVLHKLWKKFRKSLNSPFQGWTYNYASMKMGYTVFTGIISSIMLSVSILIIFIMAFVIAFILSNTILSECKLIGILKSQGFTSFGIMCIYSIQYFIISAIASIAGAILSIFTTKLLINSLVKTISVINFNYPVTLIILTTFIITNLIVLLFCIIPSLKINKITPVEAIRYGALRNSKNKYSNLKLTNFKKLNISLLLSLKQLISNKLHNAFIVLCTGVMAFIITFSLNTSYTVSRISHNLSYWGIEDSSALIHLDRFDESYVKEKLNNDPNVKILNFTASRTIVTKELDGDLVGMVYQDNIASLGLKNLKGHNPIYSNEVSIGYVSAKNLGKHIGDFITLYSNNKKATYLITGIFQSMQDMGKSVRMTSEGYKKLDKNYKNDLCYVNFKKRMSKKAGLKYLREKLNAKSGDIYDTQKDMDKSFGLSSLTSSMGSVIAMLILMVSVVCFIIIFNISSLNIFRQKVAFGIYKSFGMTGSEIRASVMYEVLFVSALGLIIGLMCAILFSSLILNMFSSAFGIQNFKMEISKNYSIFIVPCCLFVTGISSYISSARILKIHPRELVSE